MEYGKNTVCILYKIDNPGREMKFTVSPVINFRDFIYFIFKLCKIITGL